jgi:D-alanine-D-alanine ligase
LRIGISFDLAPTDPALRLEGPDDRFEEFDKPETVQAIADVIRGEGHEVILLGDGREFLTRVLADPPDFVFNIAEGEGVGRCREARVPAVLEMLGIPYSGSDPLTLSASLDKDVARRLVGQAKNQSRVSIPIGEVVPAELAADREFAANLIRKFWWDLGVNRPLILKPALEGSSKGIRGRCLAQTEDEAVSAFLELARDYDQPVLIEEFIAGDEVTIGIVGNSWIGWGLEFYGVMRIIPKRPSKRFVYSLEVKRDWVNQVDYQSPAQFPDSILSDLCDAARQVMSSLQIRDLARIDFRVRDGVPYFIEANPLPGLAPGTSDLVILARGYGIEYPDLIRKILHAALTRVGLK